MWADPIVAKVSKVKERLAAKLILIKDEVLEEIWKIKDSLAAKDNYNVEAMFRAMRLREKSSGHELVSFVKPKRKSAK